MPCKTSALDGGLLDTPIECHQTIRTSNEITNAVPKIGQLKRPTEAVRRLGCGLAALCQLPYQDQGFAAMRYNRFAVAR